MKVLMLTTSYPDFPGSQRGNFIRKLCLELNKNDIEVTVLTPRIYQQSPYYEEEAGIRVHRFWFPSGNKPLNQITSIPVMPMFIYMASGLIKALQLIVKEKPDIIHGNWIVPIGLIAALAGFFTRTPVLNTAHGMDLRISERPPVRWLFDLAARLSGKTIIVSQSMASRPVLKDCEVIPMGIDDIFFTLSPDRNGRTIIYTRSLEPVYSAETLVRSAPLVLKAIPDARFIIAGSGSQETYLKELAKELVHKNAITFLGAVPSEKIPLLMQKASVFVSSALADGTSPALLEAIASGLVPVVTDIEPNRSLVNHGKDGFLFKPGNEMNLADMIIRALSREISTQVLKDKKALMQGGICWSTIANRFINSYSQLLGGAQNRYK